MGSDNHILHFKGTLCDDHLHMTAHEYMEHKMKEHHENQRKMLRKLANNPAINDEFRDTLWNAVWNIDYMEFYRDLYIKEKEKRKKCEEQQYEQRAVKPRASFSSSGFRYDYCGACGKLLPAAQDSMKAQFCPFCGKVVKWE